MRKATRQFLKRVSPEMVASLVAHGLLVAALFLVAGLPGAPEPKTQTAVVRSTPDDTEDLLPPPEPPEIPPSEPEPPVDPTVEDEAPPEPELFEVDPDDVAPPADQPVLPETPSSRLRPNRRVIGIGSGPAQPPAARPRPQPRPVAAPPTPPPPPPTPAVPKVKSPPQYPRIAVDRELEGRVVLLVEVHPDGTVGEITVRVSSGHGVLDRAAIAAVRKWEFRPAVAQGQPVRSLVEVPISFEFEE